MLLQFSQLLSAITYCHKLCWQHCSKLFYGGAHCEPPLICEGNRGFQWSICQLCCSLANANSAAHCWAPCHLYGICFWQFGLATCESVDWFGSFSLAVSVLLPLFLRSQRSRYQSYGWVAALLWPCPPLMV